MSGDNFKDSFDVIKTFDKIPSREEQLKVVDRFCFWLYKSRGENYNKLIDFYRLDGNIFVKKVLYDVERIDKDDDVDEIIRRYRNLDDVPPPEVMKRDILSLAEFIKNNLK